MADGCEFPLPVAANSNAFVHSTTDNAPVVNEARALRVAEIITDFRMLQHQISQYQVAPAAEEYYELGYDVLRQCIAEAQAVFSAHYPGGLLQVPSSNGEKEKQQLQRYAVESSARLRRCDATTDGMHVSVMLDASARRFQAQKIYLRAVAAVRWVNSRNTILQGQRPHAGNAAALRQADTNLRAVRLEISNH